MSQDERTHNLRGNLSTCKPLLGDFSFRSSTLIVAGCKFAGSILVLSGSRNFCIAHGWSMVFLTRVQKEHQYALWTRLQHFIDIHAILHLYLVGLGFLQAIHCTRTGSPQFSTILKSSDTNHGLIIEWFRLRHAQEMGWGKLPACIEVIYEQKFRKIFRYHEKIVQSQLPPIVKWHYSPSIIHQNHQLVPHRGRSLHRQS